MFEQFFDDVLEEASQMGLGLVYVILGLVTLILAKYVFDWLTPYELDDELTEQDNPAVGVAVTGYYLGVVAIFLGAVTGPELEAAQSASAMFNAVLVDLGYAVFGIIALNIARLVVDRLLLTGFSTVKELVDDRNVGTGVVEFGSYVGSGLIIAGAVHGQGGGPGTSLVFFVLGQLTMVLFARFYQTLTSYDVHDEIEKDNVAAGMALSVNMIAISIIVFKAASADFESWSSNLTWFAIEAGFGFTLLFVLRKITDVVFLPGSSLDHEIAHDRNINAAWIEGAVANGLALMILFLL